MKALALAAMLAATPALAQAATKLSLGKAIRGDLPTVGSVDQFAVYLKAGKDYAFEVLTIDDALAKWTLRAPSGAILHSEETGESDSYGFELKAPVTGTYRLEGRSVRNDGELNTYLVRVARDCSDHLPTDCYLNLGATQSRRADYGYDIDYVRLAGLAAGKTYTVSITAGSGDVDPTIRLVNGQDTVLDEGQSITFKAATTTLYVRFRQDDDSGGGPYKLTLN